MTVEQLMAEARKTAGVDLADNEVIEPLTVLLDSLNQESQLHQKGAVAMQDKLVRLLTNRLRMKRDFAAHPEIREQKIKAPIIFCGAGRTGSTKSQKLFSKSGDFNWLSMWQSLCFASYTGEPNEDVEPRIDNALEWEKFMAEGSPEHLKGHAFEAMEPEEESLLLEHSFVAQALFGFSPVPSYLGWYAEADMSIQFKFLSDGLKYLQWQGLADPAKRWILKCPMYTGLEEEMLAVFPDAILVNTHRTPLSTVPSSIRLLETFYKPYTDAKVNAKLFIEGLSHATSTHLRNRETVPGLKILDVDYLEVVQSPESYIRKVYDFAGVELAETSMAKMLEWNANNPKHKYGKFKYAIEDYGYTDEDIKEKFGNYIAFLDNQIGG